MDSTFNPGTPVAADASAIEQELRSLWKSASEDEGSAPLIRACAGNLITLAAGREDAGRLLGVLPGVAQQHPLRSLVAYWGRAEICLKSQATSRSAPGSAPSAPFPWRAVPRSAPR
jgi:hypothetical protein